MKQYKSLDLAKFICALMIIVLHTAPFLSYSKILTFGFRNIVTVIAVPFFFLVSGFLAFKKLDGLDSVGRRRYIKRYATRLGVMYLVWSAVYFVFVAIKWYLFGFDFSMVLVYIRDFFFEGSYSTIWFLPALLSATLIVYLLHKKLSYKAIFVLSCIVYLFTLGGSSYYGLVTKLPALETVYNVYYSIFDTVKNGVCFGMLFVSMGAMISAHETRIIQKTTSKRAFVPVSVFALLLAAEAVFVEYMDWNSKGVDTVIMLVPFTFFFVRFLLTVDIKISNNLCVTMRKYSILMFLCQRIPMSIIEIFMSESIIAENSLLFFITVLVATAAIAFVIIKCSKKLKFLKYVY